MDRNAGSDPHPQTAPGDFYTCPDCCLTCSVPIEYGKGMFAYGADGSCYVQRQPVSEEDVETMFDVFESMETQCLFYAGSDPQITRRFAELTGDTHTGWSELPSEGTSDRWPPGWSLRPRRWWQFWRRRGG